VIPLPQSTPDRDEARRLAEEELARPEYAAAQPTAFDRWAHEVQQFFGRLLDPDLDANGGWLGPTLTLVLAAIIIAALVVAIVSWGRPRARRKATDSTTLLGSPDTLSAVRLRADAERAARAHDWQTAITQRYRALARGMMERDLIDPAPGATAQAIARAAAAVFPDEQPRIADAAGAFDAVRYLGAPGDEAGYLTVRNADERIVASRAGEPSLSPPPAAAVPA